eukprot:Colp12_sorted_trinity150504_noHs@34669
MSKKADVVSRLTDTSKYTGAHKERFDESGKGKGIAGRENLVVVDGSTSSAARDHTVKEAKSPSTEKKPVVAGKLGEQKFGTQADKPITITIFRNGDKHHTGEKIPPGKMKTFKTLDQLKDHATGTVKLVTGPVRKIYKQDLKTVVSKLEDFEDGGKYLCVGGEGIAAHDKLPTALLK